MSDIEELQRRLTAAMDRISAGLGGLEQSAGAENEVATLERALDEEKLANEQLNERLRKLSKQKDAAIAETEAAANAAHARVEALDLELQRLRAANDQLRQSNAALRTANEEGVGEPHLINKAMLAELEALRAARAADVAEASSIIGALSPLLTQLEIPKEENADA